MTRPPCTDVQSDVSDTGNHNGGEPSALSVHAVVRIGDEQREGCWERWSLVIVVTGTATIFYGVIALFLWKLS